MGNQSGREELEHVGYRILGVQPCSPSSTAGLVSFFDFIVAANGIPLRKLDSTFMDIIAQSEDKPLQLSVYNCKVKREREVTIVPSRSWPGEGMLGVTIRFDTYHDAEEHLCHVIDVEPNSPAELAGLVPEKDYLLGTTERVFKDSDVLYEELAQNIERPVEFYVYNSDSDEVRVVVLMPSDQWGGGLLGASVAHGMLHVLPSHCCGSIGLSSESSMRNIHYADSPFGSRFSESDIENANMNSGDENSTGLIAGESADGMNSKVMKMERKYSAGKHVVSLPGDAAGGPATSQDMLSLLR